MLEKAYYKYFERVLKEPDPEYDESPEKILSEYNIRVENTGESMDNILKIYYIKGSGDRAEDIRALHATPLQKPSFSITFRCQ